MTYFIHIHNAVCTSLILFIRKIYGHFIYDHSILYSVETDSSHSIIGKKEAQSSQTQLLTVLGNVMMVFIINMYEILPMISRIWCHCEIFLIKFNKE